MNMWFNSDDDIFEDVVPFIEEPLPPPRPRRKNQEMYRVPDIRKEAEEQGVPLRKGMSHKGTIVVDFDGVIHRYSKGWQNGAIYDPPVDGVADVLKRFMDEGYEVVVFTTRADHRVIDGVHHPGQYDQVVAYLTSHRIPFTRVHRGTGKPLGKLYIDDNALRFEGDWETTYAAAKRILEG